MRKMKKGILFGLMVSMLGLQALKSQTLEEGKSFMYYERHKSAREVFTKILATNPKNDEAAYWLGQTYLASPDRTDKDLAQAKSIYQSNLSANPNSPLLIAGMGHVELIEGKKQEARSRFETAISLSQGKSIPVLNAIGYANGSPDAKNGDPSYAIEKLKMATEIKKMNDPEVYVNLGDAYRKFADGGSAIQSYQAALAINPKYARASYRMGKVYQTQGVGQESVYMQYYNEAIAMDPKYAPVYNNLFNYYYETNVARSAEYLEKWLSNSDEDPKACYYRASLKYAQGLFNDAISKADECIATAGANPYPNLYGLKAYSYNRLKDSVNARQYFEEYLKKQSPEKIGGGDYFNYASTLLKFPGNEAQAGYYIEKAVAADTLMANKVSYYKLMGQTYEGQKKYREAASWYTKIITLKPDYGKVDLYNSGYNYFRGAVYDSSVLVFNKYTTKYPEDIFGYYMIGKSNAAIDSTGSLGLAVPAYQKAIQLGEAAPDKEKVKNQLIGSYKYMIEYQYNIKKNRDSAVYYADKAIALDPADTQLATTKDFISKNDPNVQVKKQPANKPKTTP